MSFSSEVYQLYFHFHVIKTHDRKMVVVKHELNDLISDLKLDGISLISCQCHRALYLKKKSAQVERKTGTRITERRVAVINDVCVRFPAKMNHHLIWVSFVQVLHLTVRVFKLIFISHFDMNYL